MSHVGMETTQPERFPLRFPLRFRNAFRYVKLRYVRHGGVTVNYAGALWCVGDAA